MGLWCWLQGSDHRLHGKTVYSRNGPFAEDFRDKPQIYDDADRTFVDSEEYYLLTFFFVFI